MPSMRFPFYRQHDAMDCGPTCLRMVAKYYGRLYSLSYLREKCFLGRQGVSLLGISDAAEAIGLRSLAVRIPYERLADARLPCIAHWQQRHFVVVYKIKRRKVYVADPAHGLLTYSPEEFLNGWVSAGADEGVLLLLEPTPEFHQRADDEKGGPLGFKFLLPYLLSYKKLLAQLFLGGLVGSLLELIFPFLTQALVDFGINSRNINFVYAILLAQLMLFFSKASVGLIRSWILLHVGARVNVSIISDFLAKLMKLPMAFFDAKMIGDLLQRIGDHRRIEAFLTSTTLNTVFSLVNLVLFSLVLAVYSVKIFGVFVVGSALLVVWITLFMKRRRELDYKRFSQMSDNQSHLIQLIHGMQEIKLNDSERRKRWEWERIQARLFKINLKGLSLSQYQQAGTLFIHQLKDILMTFIAAKEVIDGQMTLGMMLSVSYITGQLNGPVDQLIGFAQTAQDAKLSLERLGEVHSRPDEQDPDEAKADALPSDRTLHINGLSFQYEGPHSEYVLKDVTAQIPYKKTTAIVGASGSGKTTLLKLLLKFYPPTSGEVRIGPMPLAGFNTRVWRQKCGAVMQDGYIFSDTIANNIALADEAADREKLQHAVAMANIAEFIEKLPLGFKTKIGMDGHGLSQGQKQRILIARAIYKDPEFIFFDEATSALDAHNERAVMNNLETLWRDKTVVIVAHRLSTVKNADQIIVLDNGQVVEQGTHEQLTQARGAYYHLVKNQLELGN